VWIFKLNWSMSIFIKPKIFNRIQTKILKLCIWISVISTTSLKKNSICYFNLIIKKHHYQKENVLRFSTFLEVMHNKQNIVICKFCVFFFWEKGACRQINTHNIMDSPIVVSEPGSVWWKSESASWYWINMWGTHIWGRRMGFKCWVIKS
jgi:hypothetical protein